MTIAYALALTSNADQSTSNADQSVDQLCEQREIRSREYKNWGIKNQLY
jgi:hypothetical protein